MHPTTLTIGSRLGGPDAMCLDFGPGHPMNAGFLPVAARLEGDVVVGLDPEPGHLHRGVEALFEVRDYRQALSLANRHDWHAPVFGELAIALVVEAELGVGVPERATWLRTILAEHARVASHLAFLGFVGWRLDRPDLSTAALGEELRRRTLELTGNRLHPTAVRLGGIAVDANPAWAEAERVTVTAASELATRLTEALTSSGLGAGVAPVTTQHVAAYGLAGPIARSSGVTGDLRRDVPHLAYPALGDLLAPPDAPTTGDAAARFAWLAAEVRQSASLVTRLLDTLPDGDLAVRLPNVVKLPEGDAQVALEAPLGRAGVFTTSRGDKVPWRLSLRTPSLANVAAWSRVVPGTRLDDLTTALASLPFVTGDLEK